MMHYNTFAVPKPPSLLYARYLREGNYCHGSTCGGAPSAHDCAASCIGCIWTQDRAILQPFVDKLLTDPEFAEKYHAGKRRALPAKTMDRITQLKHIAEDMFHPPKEHRDFSKMSLTGFTPTDCAELIHELAPYDELIITYTPGDQAHWRAALGHDPDSGYIITHLRGECLHKDMLDMDMFLSEDDGEYEYWESFGDSAEEALLHLFLRLVGTTVLDEPSFTLLPTYEEA